MSHAAALSAAPSGRRALDAVERAVGLVTEATAAVLVVAEVVILLLGVVSRFVFDAPLVWSDEVASLLFLWLAMAGAAIALRRGAHMRLSTVTARLPARWRPRFEALGVGVPLLFLGLLVGPARDYVEDQGFIETPALGWPGSVRAYAMLVGIGLMLLISLLRLARLGWRDAAAAALALGAVAALLWVASPALTAMGNWNLLVFFVALVGVGVLLGVPIAFAFGLATAAYLLTTSSTPLAVVVGRLDEGMSSLILLAVPLFVLLGLLVEATGMARAMVAFLAALIGHVRGGLSYVLLGGMLLVSGISGSKAADMAAVAPVLFPDMKRRGLDEGEMVSLLAASGAMAETIPPSLVLIAIASVTGVSVSALFTGGLLPGLVLAAALAFLARGRTREAATARAPLSAVGRTFLVGLPALVLPVIIRTAVVEGVATATEVSTIGIAYCIIVGILFYRQFDWRRAYPILVETATLSGAILFIIGAATSMAWALTQSGFSGALARAMGSVPGGQWGFLAISVAAFIVLGSVLEGIPAMVLFGPLLFPIARQIGVNEVHYAIVIILAMGIGLFAPPFGLGYYTACTIGRVHPDVALRKIWPYLGVLTVTLLLIAAVPWFSTGFLP
ncbi:TRAP transporter large permease subunit [Lichenibacterium dinghuense]|uniref:TRAP transporter large permease n=1 Tax=Lichenibacterium dinghuense TaxID=2895977 RepID=UPI001F00ED35|nr:TRAP transporter large permease subunit [Lichenibacterium sp. 6Y81]